MGVSNAAGDAVAGDPVHFGVGVRSGAGPVRNAQHQRKDTNDQGNADITYTASTSNVSCWVLAVEAEGGRTAEAVIYQGTTRDQSPTFNASYPTKVQAGGSTGLHDQGDQPHVTGRPLDAAALRDLPGRWRDEKRQRRPGALVVLDRWLERQFVPVALTGSTIDEGAIQGYVGPLQGVALAPRLDHDLHVPRRARLERPGLEAQAVAGVRGLPGPDRSGRRDGRHPGRHVRLRGHRPGRGLAQLPVHRPDRGRRRDRAGDRRRTHLAQRNSPSPALVGNPKVERAATAVTRTIGGAQPEAGRPPERPPKGQIGDRSDPQARRPIAPSHSREARRWRGPRLTPAHRSRRHLPANGARTAAFVRHQQSESRASGGCVSCEAGANRPLSLDSAAAVVARRLAAIVVSLRSPVMSSPSRVCASAPIPLARLAGPYAHMPLR